MAVKKKKRENERRYRCQGVCGWVVFIAYYICYLTFSLLAGREGFFTYDFRQRQGLPYLIEDTHHHDDDNDDDNDDRGHHT